MDNWRASIHWTPAACCHKRTLVSFIKMFIGYCWFIKLPVSSMTVSRQVARRPTQKTASDLADSQMTDHCFCGMDSGQRAKPTGQAWSVLVTALLGRREIAQFSNRFTSYQSIAQSSCGRRSEHQRPLFLVVWDQSPSGQRFPYLGIIFTHICPVCPG